MPSPLTQRQNQALDFIRGYIRESRKPPTLKEIGVALGMRSSNGVFKVLQALEAKGYIQREPNQARGLSLNETEDPFTLIGSESPTLPVVSRTSSSDPASLWRQPNGYLSVDPFWIRGADRDRCLLARVGDDGMNSDGIRKGDVVVVEEVDAGALANGSLAACLVGEDLRVRRFHAGNGRYQLRPADRRYTEDVFAPNDPGCYIIGRVLAVMRKL